MRVAIIGCTLLFLVFSSCLQRDGFDTRPLISFKDFQTMGDTAWLTIRFTDGDGNVGLHESEIYSPYDTSGPYHYNLYVRYFEKVNGEFQPGLTTGGNPMAYKFRVPVLTPKGENKAIKGEMRVTLSPYYYIPPPFSLHSDTIRYEVQLIDRAHNWSNVLVTPEYIR